MKAGLAASNKSRTKLMHALQRWERWLAWNKQLQLGWAWHARAGPGTAKAWNSLTGSGSDDERELTIGDEAASHTLVWPRRETRC